MTIMKRSGALLLLGAIFMGLSGSAQAHGFTAGRALLDARTLAHAAADTQTLTIINHANIRPWVLDRVEQAIQNQIDGPVREHWRTPLIRFAPGGERVILGHGTDNWCPRDADGCHVPGPGTISETGYSTCYPCVITTYSGPVDPVAVVATQGDRWSDGMAPTWTSVMDHEIVEMLVDPMLSGDEVCDPVETDVYQADNGTNLSDFVYPSYFQPRAHGPFDLLGDAHAPLSDPSGA